MSKLRVNESSEQDFIKVILTENQGRSKRDKEWIRIRKTGYIKLGVLEIAFYFSKGFSEAADRVSVVAKAPWLLRVTMVYFLK